MTENFLLPKSLKPTFYDLQIRPYVGPKEVWGEKAFTFEGRIEIYFKCLEPTRQVIFHSKDLRIEFAGFRSFNHPDSIKMSKRFEFDTAKDFVIGNLNQECKVNGTYALKLKFYGRILDKLYGFYISSYQEKNATVK